MEEGERDVQMNQRGHERWSTASFWELCVKVRTDASVVYCQGHRV